MRTTLSNRPRAGFTLIELTISTALMSLILISAYACLHAGFATRKLIEPRVDAVQSARVALSLLAADLRAACPLSKETEFVGMDRTLRGAEADNLDFATHQFTPRHEREGDYCQVSYFLEPDPDSDNFILWRRRNPRIALDPFSGGRREELARGVQQLRFEYYDGLDWYDSWGNPDGRPPEATSWRAHPNLYGMPEAVRITLWMDPESPSRRRSETPEPSTTPPSNRGSLVLQTVARLNLAPRYTSTSSSPSSSSGGTPSNSAGPESGSVVPTY